VPLIVDLTKSEVEIVVKSNVDSFTGKLASFTPAILVDSDAHTVKSARISFHFADVKTGKDSRDEAMNSWQDTPHQPDGLFTLSTLTPSTDGKMTATGSLLLHGTTHELAFPATVTYADGLYTIAGDATLDTQNFGLPIIRKFLVLRVDPLVQIVFHLQGRTVVTDAFAPLSGTPAH
jgi:polyisoprenoid-binding protein YceI